MSAKILLVDDEVDLVEVTKARLESKGFEVVCAYDGLDAVNKAKEHKPVLILMDLFMPIMHGYEACKKLQEDADLKNIPVIVFSAGDCKKSCIKAAKEAGAVDFIAKPFESEELLDKISFYIK